MPNAIAKHYTRAIMGLSALLALLCIVMATSLYRQQVEILELQQQTVRALHAADALGESMIDLSFLLKDQVADVSILHSRIEQNLQKTPGRTSATANNNCWPPCRHHSRNISNDSIGSRPPRPRVMRRRSPRLFNF
ncbi:MAG: hypothetical protein ACK5WR_09585 [Planctomycetaceae bacterium]